jgi:hypothetical protein
LMKYFVLGPNLELYDTLGTDLKFVNINY